MGCQQCLPLSVVQLKGKHCRKPHCHNEVVDTFEPYALDFIKDIGRRIKESNGEKQAAFYLMQAIGIAIQ